MVNLNKFSMACTSVLVLSVAHIPAGLTADVKEYAWMDKGKQAVKARLKDPGSAKFQNVYFHRGGMDIPVTCGEVNSKNSFGGYTGFQRFVSGGKAELTFLETEAADFSSVWRQLCVN